MNLVKRSGKKSFWGIPSDGGSVTEYTRMKGFTDLSMSKNPKEYSRQYVDEDMERTDVVGYSDSCSFSFDKHTDNAVLEDIAGIFDGNKLGADAQREVVIVDFTKSATGGGYEAIKYTFAVIADAEGDGTDAYTYSGTLRSSGARIMGVAKIKAPENGNSENVETVEFTEATETVEASEY